MSTDPRDDRIAELEAQAAAMDRLRDHVIDTHGGPGVPSREWFTPDVLIQLVEADRVGRKTLGDEMMKLLAERDRLRARVEEVERERDDRRESLAQEIREGLRTRSLWTPAIASDLITAIFQAIDGARAEPASLRSTVERLTAEASALAHRAASETERADGAEATIRRLHRRADGERALLARWRAVPEGERRLLADAMRYELPGYFGATDTGPFKSATLDIALALLTDAAGEGSDGAGKEST